MAPKRKRSEAEELHFALLESEREEQRKLARMQELRADPRMTDVEGAILASRKEDKMKALQLQLERKMEVIKDFTDKERAGLVLTDAEREHLSQLEFDVGFLLDEIAGLHAEEAAVAGPSQAGSSGYASD